MAISSLDCSSCPGKPLSPPSKALPPRPRPHATEVPSASTAQPRGVKEGAGGRTPPRLTCHPSGATVHGAGPMSARGGGLGVLTPACPPGYTPFSPQPEIPSLPDLSFRSRRPWQSHDQRGGERGGASCDHSLARAGDVRARAHSFSIRERELRRSWGPVVGSQGAARRSWVEQPGKAEAGDGDAEGGGRRRPPLRRSAGLRSWVCRPGSWSWFFSRHSNEAWTAYLPLRDRISPFFSPKCVGERSRILDRNKSSLNCL